MTETEIRNLLALCEAADDQDTGSLDAFREGASAGVVADLCRAWLAQARVMEAARLAVMAYPCCTQQLAAALEGIG